MNLTAKAIQITILSTEVLLLILKDGFVNFKLNTVSKLVSANRRG